MPNIFSHQNVIYFPSLASPPPLLPPCQYQSKERATLSNVHLQHIVPDHRKIFISLLPQVRRFSFARVVCSWWYHKSKYSYSAFSSSKIGATSRFSDMEASKVLVHHLEAGSQTLVPRWPSQYPSKMGCTQDPIRGMAALRLAVGGCKESDRWSRGSIRDSFQAKTNSKRTLTEELKVANKMPVMEPTVNARSIRKKCI